MSEKRIRNRKTCTKCKHRGTPATGENGTLSCPKCQNPFPSIPEAPVSSPPDGPCRVPEAEKAPDRGEEPAIDPGPFMKVSEDCNDIIKFIPKEESMPKAELRPGNSNIPFTEERKTEKKPTARNDQEILDELIRKRGSNFPSHSDYVEVLALNGLKPADVTPAMLRRADDHAREWLIKGFKEHNNNRGRGFNVVLQGDMDLDPGMKIPPCPGPEKKKSGKADGSSDNENSVSDSTQTGGTEMSTAAAKEASLTVNEEDARNLLTALGKPAAEWSAKFVAKKLAKLVLDDGGELEDKDLVALFKRILKANSDGDKIELAEDVEEEAPKAEANGKDSSNGKHHGNGKAKAAKPKREKAKKEGSGRPKVRGKYSAGSFVRWLGKQGVGFDGAKEILAGEGADSLADVSVKWELKETRENKPAASVEKSDAAELRAKYPGAFAAAKPAKKAEKKEKASAK